MLHRVIWIEALFFCCGTGAQKYDLSDLFYFLKNKNPSK